MSELIKIHTNKNNTILDPFMGSGSTGVASLLNERNFIGIELEKKYFNIAKKRMEEFLC
jgi:DNA modification methylase